MTLWTPLQLIISMTLGIFSAACLFVGVLGVLDRWRESEHLPKVTTAAVVVLAVGVCWWLAPLDMVFWCAVASVVVLVVALILFASRAELPDI